MMLVSGNRVALLLVLLTCMMREAAADAGSANATGEDSALSIVEQYMAKESPRALHVFQGRRWSGSAAMSAPVLLGGPHLWKVELARRLGHIQVNAAVETGSGDWASIHSRKSESELSFPPDDPAQVSESEINRPRGERDQWNWTALSIGLGVESKLFSSWTQRLTNRAALHLMRTQWNDRKNEIPFSSWMFRVEATESWQLAVNGPWEAFVGASWTLGNATTTFDGQRSEASRSLELRYFSLALGLTRNWN